MGIDNIPMIFAFNKADLVEEEFPAIKGNRVYLSAKQNIGLDELVERINQQIFKNPIHCEMLIPFDDGRLISYLNENANVLSTKYEYNGTLLSLECNSNDFEKYQQYVI
jgi:GTPase